MRWRTFEKKKNNNNHVSIFFVCFSWCSRCNSHFYQCILRELKFILLFIVLLKSRMAPQYWEIYEKWYHTLFSFLCILLPVALSWKHETNPPTERKITHKRNPSLYTSSELSIFIFYQRHPWKTSVYFSHVTLHHAYVKVGKTNNLSGSWAHP